MRRVERPRFSQEGERIFFVGDEKVLERTFFSTEHRRGTADDNYRENVSRSIGKTIIGEKEGARETERRGENRNVRERGGGERSARMKLSHLTFPSPPRKW